MTLFRLHIRPTAGKGNPKISCDYCKKYGLLGMGWQIDSQTNTNDWNVYEKEAVAQFANISNVRYFRNSVKRNDLIWTRDEIGKYILAKVESDWEYLSNNEAVDADIVNVVHCKFENVSFDDVPGKVIACFRPPKTFQAIDNDIASIYSKHLWNTLTNSNEFDVSEELNLDIFQLLDSETTEDLIFIYLQLNGWIIVPNSRKCDTMAYEFYAINRETNEKMIVQVKTGNVFLDAKHFESYKERVLLFQSSGKYGKSDSPMIECLDPAIMKMFISKYITKMPGKISNWYKKQCLTSDVADARMKLGTTGSRSERS